MKGIELLIPDNTNFEASKFILLKTGALIMKSGGTNTDNSNLHNTYVRN
jgi:hypothetical protein